MGMWCHGWVLWYLCCFGDSAHCTTVGICTFHTTLHVTGEDAPYTLEWDMGPFNAHFPSMSRYVAAQCMCIGVMHVRDHHPCSFTSPHTSTPCITPILPSMHSPSSIGEGVSYLNRLLSSRLMVHSAGQDNMQLLFEFLRMHRRDGVPLMINEDMMVDLPTMARALARAIRFLDSFPPEVRTRNLCVFLLGKVFTHTLKWHCYAFQHHPLLLLHRPPITRWMQHSSRLALSEGGATLCHEHGRL